jgi:hypothetical protein
MYCVHIEVRKGCAVDCYDVVMADMLLVVLPKLARLDVWIAEG